ncbi:MAG: M23 family metallopeptidase [Clostridia bacterium]|nr:M23 family metallopeptidase [Clostridia bacterium]
MRNKIIIAILVVLMFVPSVVAIIDYNIENDGVTHQTNVVSMSLIDPQGNPYEFTPDGGDEHREMIEYFLSIAEKAEEIESLPVTVESGGYCRLDITTKASDSSKKLYFKTNAEDCYFVDGDGRCFLMAKSKAEIFLESPYSAYLYENGTAPMLTVNGQTLVPDTCTWNYVNSTGEYIEAIPTVVDSVESVTTEGGLAMEFINEPDSLEVKLTDKATGEELPDLAGLIIQKDMVIRVEVTAKWFEDKTRNYYGEQTFVFEASLSAPAEFYAGVKTVELGEFICVTAKNVSQPENIKFACEPAIDFEPKFFMQDDGCAYALVPFADSLEEGHYTLTFSYGGASQNINVDVTVRKNAPTGVRAKTYDGTTIDNFYKPELITKAEETLLPIAQSSVEEIYFSGVFLGTDDDIVTGYGHTINITGTDISYVHTGLDYQLPANTDVKAVNAGKVVYAGMLDYAGYIVVVDHGLGLKSWYAHMGGVSVKEGDIVEKGDKVGVTGSSGFINVTGVHIGLTVFDTPVCQYALWADGKYAAAGNPGVQMYKTE